MKEHDAWRRLLYPGTNLLRNKFDERNGQKLSDKEQAITTATYCAFLMGEIIIEGDNSQEKLEFIHEELFGAIFEWAGQTRDVNMSKGGQSFGDHSSMDMYLRQLDGQISRTSWEDMEFEETVGRLAELHTHLNFAHPFREGNGRTSRVFMDQLATQHGVELNFAGVGDEEWNKASAETFLDPGGVNLTAEPMKRIYETIAQPI